MKENITLIVTEDWLHLWNTKFSIDSKEFVRIVRR